MRPATLALVTLILLAGCAQQNEQMTEEKAVGFVKEHMQINYKGAETSVFLVTPQDGSWKITAKVVYGAGTPCPNASIVVYEYPKFGFVPREQNIITSDCEVLGCRGIPNCRIVMPEEAVIASHKLNNISEVNSFIREFGYENMRVDAAFYDSYYEPKNNSTYRSVWVVRWNSPLADYSVKLILNQTGGGVVAKFIE